MPSPISEIRPEGRPPYRNLILFAAIALTALIVLVQFGAPFFILSYKADGD